MADAITTFIAKLQSHYDLPHGLNADAKQARIIDITRRMGQAADEDSRVPLKVMEIFPDEYKRRTLPTLRDVIDVIATAQQQLREADAQAKAATRQARQEDRQREYTDRANAALRTDLGRRAAEEGWINGLYDFVERHGREPGPMEINDIQGKSRDLMRSLDDAPEGAPAIGSVRRAVLARKERLTRIALEGEPIPAADEELGL